MIRDDDVHLMASAGDPQTEPGPQCQEWSKAAPDPDTDFRSALARLWHLLRPTGMCDGCFGRHPGRWTAKGLMLEPHEPSPPQHTQCGDPRCNGKLDPPSYTPAIHKGCGGDDSDGYGEEL